MRCEGKQPLLENSPYALAGRGADKEWCPVTEGEEWDVSTAPRGHPAAVQRGSAPRSFRQGIPQCHGDAQPTPQALRETGKLAKLIADGIPGPPGDTSNDIVVPPYLRDSISAAAVAAAATLAAATLALAALDLAAGRLHPWRVCGGGVAPADPAPRPPPADKARAGTLSCKSNRQHKRALAAFRVAVAAAGGAGGAGESWVAPAAAAYSRSRSCLTPEELPVGAAALGPIDSCSSRFKSYFAPEELGLAAAAAAGAGAREAAQARLRAGGPAPACASAQVGIVTGGGGGGGGWPVPLAVTALLLPTYGAAGSENAWAPPSPPRFTAAAAAAARRMELLGAELTALAAQFRAELHLAEGGGVYAVTATPPSTPPSSPVAALGSPPPPPPPPRAPSPPPPAPPAGGGLDWGRPAAAALAGGRFERAPRAGRAVQA
jgi:hypothetical protein